MLTLHHPPQSRQRKNLYIGPVIGLILACILFLLPTSVFAHTTQAADNGPTFQTTVGFDGNFRDGSWIPIQITLNNSGAEFNGAVSVNIPNPYLGPNSTPSSVYQQTIDLPPGAQKSITLYVPFPPGFQSSTQNISIDLLDANGHKVKTQQANSQVLGGSDVFVGIVSDQQRGFGSLSSVKLAAQGARVDTTTLTVDTFPSVAAVLKNFDMLILDHFQTGSLSQSQLSALQAWVNQGGTLVIAGGPEWQQTISALPASLLPVTITGTTTLPAGTPLLPVGGPARSGSASQDDSAAHAAVTVSTATAKTGANVLLSSGNTPLIVHTLQGQGHVYYLAFDPSLDPLLSWTGATDLWYGIILRTMGDKVIINNGSPGVQQAFSLQNSGGTNSMLLNLLPNALPATWLILALLAGYVLILGPIRLLVVRRFKKRSWSWRIVLSTILVFSLLSYGLALVVKGTSIISDSVTVLQLGTGSNSSAHATTYVGVYVPNQGNFLVHVPGENLVQPATDQSGGGPTSQQNQQTTIKSTGNGTDVNLQGVDIWSLRALTAEHDMQLQGGIASHLSIQRGILSGTVTNTLPYALSDAYVLLGNQYVSIGHISAGESAQVQLTLTSSQDGSQDQTQPLINQIAASNGSQPYYNRGSGPQNEVQRHLSILLSLSGQGYYNCGSGSCAVPAMGMRVFSKGGGVVYMSGGGGFFKGGPGYSGYRDPLLIPNAPATLIGWADHATDATNNVTINGNHVNGLQETLIQAPLGVTFSDVSYLPASLVSAQIVDVAPDSNLQMTGPAGVYTMQTGKMTFEYTLPASSGPSAGSIKVSELALSQFVQQNGAGGQGGPDANSLQATVYNWQTQSWDAFTFSKFEFSTAPGRSQAYIDTTGRILVQLASPATSNTPITFSIPSVQIQS